MATRESQHNPREMSAGAYPHQTSPSPDPSSGEIRSDIRRTRAEMDQTVDALADRLQPRHLLDDLLDAFRGSSGDGAGSDMKDRAKQLGSSALSKLKNHPMPAALIGAGIAWLVFEDSSGDGHAANRARPGRWRDQDLREHSGSFVDARTGRPYDDSYGQAGERVAGPGGDHGSDGPGMLGQVRDKAAKVGQQISDTAGSAAATVAEATSYFRGQAEGQITSAYSGARPGARRGYDYGRRGVEQALDEYPLAATAAALAAGVLTGLLLPGTRYEDELAGDQAHRLKEQAKEKGREVVRRGKDVAEAAVGAASDEARRHGVTPAALADKAKHVAQAVAGAAGDAAEREGLSDLPGKAKAVADRAKEAAQDKGRQQAGQMKEQAERP